MDGAFVLPVKLLGKNAPRIGRKILLIRLTGQGKKSRSLRVGDLKLIVILSRQISHRVDVECY